MRLYLYMVLGGSICTFLYIIFNHILSHEGELRWKRIFIKVNMLFYLAPLPWMAAELKAKIAALLELERVTLLPGGFGNEIDPQNIWGSLVVWNAENELVYISGYRQWTPVILIGMLVFVSLLAGWVISFRATISYYKKDITYIGIKKSGKIKVQIGTSPKALSPIAFGIIRPTILLPEDGNYQSSIDGIVCHELQHFRNGDSLLRFLGFVILAIEWYNPFVYYLLRENIAVSEMLCDDAATRDMSKSEKAAYMQCVLDSVEKKKRSEVLIMNLGNSRSLTKKRMERIMEKGQKKIWKKGFAICVMAGCFFASSIPALAYREPIVLSESEECNHTAETWSNLDKVTFVPEGETESHGLEYADYSRGNCLFIDEAGREYFYDGKETEMQGAERVVCSHTYVNGTVKNHETYEDGSCKESTYSAKRCTKCGRIETGELLSVNTFNPCPHK